MLATLEIVQEELSRVESNRGEVKDERTKCEHHALDALEAFHF